MVPLNPLYTQTIRAFRMYNLTNGKGLVNLHKCIKVTQMKDTITFVHPVSKGFSGFFPVVDGGDPEVTRVKFETEKSADKEFAEISEQLQATPSIH